MSSAEEIVSKDEVEAEPTAEDVPSETAGEDHDEKAGNPEESCLNEIKNLPNHVNYPVVMKFLQKQLPNTQLRKMKTVKGTTYVSFSSHDEAKTAVEKLGASIKNRKLQVRFAAEEPQTPANTAPMEPPKSAKELFTLHRGQALRGAAQAKHEDNSWTASTLLVNMRQCGIDWAN